MNATSPENIYKRVIRAIAARLSTVIDIDIKPVIAFRIPLIPKLLQLSFNPGGTGSYALQLPKLPGGKQYLISQIVIQCPSSTDTCGGAGVFLSGNTIAVKSLPMSLIVARTYDGVWNVYKMIFEDPLLADAEEPQISVGCPGYGSSAWTASILYQEI